MQVSYKPLWRTMLEKGMSKEDLRKSAKLTTNAIANMGKDQNVSLSTIVKVCEALGCNIDSVIEIKDFDQVEESLVSHRLQKALFPQEKQHLIRQN